MNEINKTNELAMEDLSVDIQICGFKAVRMLVESAKVKYTDEQICLISQIHSTGIPLARAMDMVDTNEFSNSKFTAHKANVLSKKYADILRKSAYQKKSPNRGLSNP